MKEENKKKNEELQSRRQFFKKAGKAALPILGAIALSAVPLQINASQTCPCSGTCTACVGGCMDACARNCKACSNGCASGCHASCYTGCNGKNKGYA